MPYIAKPIDRDQVTLNTLDSMVEWNSTARVIDHFVDCLDGCITLKILNQKYILTRTVSITVRGI